MTDKFEQAHIVVVTVLCFFSFCAVSLFVLTCYKFYDYIKNKDDYAEKEKPSTSRLYIAFFGILSNMIAVISLCLAKIFIPSNYWIGAPNIIVSHAWATGNALAYLLFLRLIHDLFDNTIYKPSRVTYVICLLFIFTFFFAENMVGFIQILLTVGTISVDAAYSYIGNCLTATTIADLVTMSILLSVFTTKLMKITANTASKNDLRRITEHNILGRTQQEFVYAVTKQTLLTFVGTITTQTVGFWGIGVSKVNSSNSDNTWILTIASDSLYIWCAWEFFCIASVMFLTLEFNFRYYEKICYCFHGCCNYCCSKVTKSRIIREKGESMVINNVNDENVNDENENNEYDPPLLSIHGADHEQNDLDNKEPTLLTAQRDIASLALQSTN